MPKKKLRGCINTSDLLGRISQAQCDYIKGVDSRHVFEDLLNHLLSVTNSEYGFIGQSLVDENGNPYLHTFAITDISWNARTRKHYQEYRERGLVFKNLDTLWGLVFTTMAPVISNDPENDERRGGKSVLPQGHPPLYTFLGIPFLYNGELIGMAGLANRPAGYSAKLVSELEPFTNTCTSLIQGIKLQKQTDKAIAEREELMSKISHELRTPLNSILGFSELLMLQMTSDMSDDVSKKCEYYVKMIRTNGRLLLALIDDVLQFNNQREATFTALRLHVLVEQQRERFRMELDEKHITFSNCVPESLVVLGDEDMVTVVLQNLVSNAIKYNKQNGSITISATATQDEFALTITDSGIGISKDEIERLNEPFFRGSNTVGVRGTGLGLANVQKFMEKINWCQSVSSVVGEGTTFTLRGPTSTLREHSCSVVSLEDTESNILYMREVMETLGLDMMELTCAEEFDEYFVHTSSMPRCFFIDIHVNGKNGCEFIRQIRSRDYKVPIIALTADARAKCRKECLDAGANEYITKPASLSVLKRALKKYRVL